ncbi:MAG: lysozyme [Sphingomonadales bacterium]|nr:MAG: lysozyme [Sphingomonadales bacterium]
MADKLKKRTLVSVVGAATAALLLVNIPAEESGRKVDVKIADDGTATMRHISGKQYLKAYLDVVDVATACDGLTSYKGRKIRITDQFTEAQCAAMLEEELIVHAEGVMQCTPGLALTIPRRDHVRFAMISLAYNVGVSTYCKSTARKRINAGDIAGACEALTWFNRAGGKINRGLVARRGRERAECMKDIA